MPISNTNNNNSNTDNSKINQQLQNAEAEITVQHNLHQQEINYNNDDDLQQRHSAAAPPLRRFKQFDDMPLHQLVLRGIYSFGFEKPSEIQQTATVPIARGGDVIAQASAGSGKTGAFCIGFLQRLDVALRRTQVLVLSPTRELTKQTFDVTLGIGQYLLGDLLDAGAEPVALLSSNVPVKENIDTLLHATTKGNALVAVGTPGRVKQLFDKGALRPEHLRTIVLDEADELFSQGFNEQIFGIFRYLPRDIQVVLVSATLPEEVRTLADKFMRSPTKILLEPERIPVESIRQYTVEVSDSEEKLLVLADLYERISIAQSIIFVNSRRRAEYIAGEMRRQGFTVALTHGELSREEREHVIDKFRRGESRVLVSTDLLGRGIDVYHVNLVINFELPMVVEKYIHRVGRCGRCGRKGCAINLIARNEGTDLPLMKEIERTFGIKTSPLPVDFDSSLDFGK